MLTGALRNWDVGLIILLLIGNGMFPVAIRNVTQQQNIDAIYEKIKICLTTISILLAASGLFASGLAFRGKVSTIRRGMMRTFTWFVIALLASIVTLGTIPTHMGPDQLLFSSKHVAVIMWLYFTGPLIFGSLAMGVIWLVVTIRTFVRHLENIELWDEDS